MNARFYDVRHCSEETLQQILLSARDDLVVSASQIARCPTLIRDRRLVAVVPDFLEYARLLSTHQFRDVAAKPGSLRNFFRACSACSRGILRKPLRLSPADFWLVAEMLLRFDLALLHEFFGHVVLHPYLTDFAVGLGRDDFLVTFSRLCRPWRYWGLWTNQLPMALSACARLALQPSLIVFASAAGDTTTQAALNFATQNPLFERTSFLLDLVPCTVGEDVSLERLAQRHPHMAGSISLIATNQPVTGS